jgi:hypothetical protein
VFPIAHSYAMVEEGIPADSFLEAELGSFVVV